MNTKKVVIQVTGGVVEPLFISKGVDLKITDHDNEETWVCFQDKDGDIRSYPEE
jgi:hypothetical protein